MKKPSRKTLIRKLDAKVRELVLARTPYCVTCGSRENLQPGHFFSRTHYSIRWSLDNVWTQCRNCNLKHEQNSWPYTKWMIETFGQGKVDELNALHNTITHFKSSDLEEMLLAFSPKKEEVG